jgi:hypothetical protein
MLDKTLFMSASIQSDFADAGPAGLVASLVLEKAMDVIPIDEAAAAATFPDRPIFDDELMSMWRDGFCFQSPAGVLFRYERGQRLGMHVPAGCDDEAKLFLWGSVFGAVAWLNDLLPLHASAVSCGGRVIAFTGDSGAGKSTLAAALAQRGLAHVCDDTLILSPSNSGLIALPDGKPTKLWEDAFELVAAERSDKILTVPGKSYAIAQQICTDRLPLRDLVFLEDGDDVQLVPIKGGNKLEQIPQAMYRSLLHAARDDTAYHAQLMVMVATTVRCWKLRRPRNRASFSKDADLVASLLRRIETL